MNNKGKRTLSAILAGLILTSMSSTVLAEETTTNKEHVEQINQIKPNEVTSQQPDIQQNLTAPQVELFDFSLDNLIDGIHTWGIDHGQVDNDTGKLGSQLTGYSVDFMKQIEDVAKNGTVIDGSLLENITVKQSDGTTKEIEAVKINLGKITIPIENGNAQETLNTHWATISPDILAAGGAFLHDHPEVFYLNGQVYSGAATAMQGQNVLILEPYIAFTYQNIYQDRESRIERNNQMNQKIDEITSAVSGQTPIEQLNYFNAWLTMNNRYNPLLPNEPSTAHEATSALLSNSALEANKNDGPVCEGYAKAMKLLCEKVGIPCAIPVGLAKSSANDQGENHMWNYVKLDGKWYAIDVTWNDPIYSGTTVTDKLGLKSYFLIGSQTPNHNGLAFSDGHQENGVILPGYVFDYPTISTTAHQDAEKVYLISETPVTLTNQADLKIGDKISDGQLTGGTYFMLDQGNKKTVAGKLAWENPNNTLTDGENTLTWEFTPDNSSLNCFPVTGSFIVKLDKESGTQEAGYQEPKNLSIAYQTGLTLKEVALPDGWTWDNPDTILTVGTKNYPATYTPEDTEMYTPVKKELSVAVTQTSLSLDVQTDLDKQWHGQDIKLIVTVAEDKTKALPAADDINIKATNAKVKTALEATNTPNVFEATYTVEGENDDIASFVVTVQNDEFGAQTQTVEVTILEEYTNELSGTPTSVKLGEDIDVTNMQLKTEHESGKEPITTKVTLDMLSGYDKEATGQNSIGTKTITVKIDENRFATFDITVEDVVKGLEVTAPNTVNYDWCINGNTLDLTGATVSLLMQSQIKQPAVELTQDMIDITDRTLSLVGNYPVTVSYQEFTKTNAFTIIVNDKPINTPITEAPSKDKPSASITELPETIKESDVVLIITSISEKLKDIVGKIQEELANLEQQTLSFSASLIDTANENAQINASGKVTITIPYPADTSKDKFTFTLYKLKAATTREVDPEKVEIPCTTTENGIQFTENSAGDLGNYIIAYQEKDSSDSNHPSDNENVGIIIGSTTAGWKQNETGWRYEYSDGTYSVNQWEQIDKIWYHFDDNGYMQTGWINIPSGWYYLNPDGSMTTGWQLIDGKWYYMNEQGTMQTGWIQVSSGWYYLNPDGSMTTGWQLIDDTWYYLNEQGTMQTGWIQINDTWYLLDQSGAMLTGWHWVGDNCYYMDQTGAMLAGVTTPDGYQVDASGAWIE